MLLASFVFALSIQATPLKQRDHGSIVLPLGRTERRPLTERDGDGNPHTVNGVNIPITVGGDLTVDVNLGSSGIPFKLVLDTGSADTWVTSENCQPDDKSGGGCRLGPTTSTTFKPSDTTWDVVYATGDVVGIVVEDTMVIGGLAMDSKTFGVANSENLNFTQVPNFMGIMGLAPGALQHASIRTETPVETLFSKGLIPNSIISFFITRSDSTDAGEISLGGLDPTKFDASTLITMPLAPGVTGGWEVSLTDLTVNGNSIFPDQDSGRTAILDTGTTFMAAPATDAMAIHNLIPGAKPDGQGGFTVPCNMADSVALVFGRPFTISPQDIVVPGPVDNNGNCGSAIGIIDVNNNNTYDLGLTFLKNVYFSVNYQELSVTLASLSSGN